MAKTDTPTLRNERKEKEQAKAQADQALIDARALAEKYNLTYTSMDTVESLGKAIAKAKADGVIPNGEAAPEISNRSLGIVRAAAQVKEVKDIEISSQEELSKYQESKKLIGFGGWTIEKNVGGEVVKVPAKDESGSYGYIPGAKGIVRIALSLMLMLMASVSAFAGLDGTEEGVLGNERWKTTSGGDFVPVADSVYSIGAVGAEVEALYVDEITLTSDLTFRSTLIGTGRVNASLTLASSSTIISGTKVPYALIRKNIGAGTGGLDTVDGGTRLANGTPGAFVSIIIASCGSGSYWDLTPVTKTGFTSIRFTAKGQTALLLYVDDTIGWTIAGIGTTASAASPTVTPSAFGSGLEPLV